MRVGATVPGTFGGEADDAVRLEAAGFNPLWVAETNHDPFLRCLLIGQATSQAQVGTSISVAFARSPMTLAYTGYDLARYTQGRFVLGLGSQVRQHIERRFSMLFDQPAARMRELIQAMHAIWACWHDGEALAFEGQMYRHVLMTPFFTPERHEWGPPPVYLAGVGELMTEVAGEVADGYLAHAFTTQRYLQEVTIPALDRGRARSGKLRPAISTPALVATGRNDQEISAAIAAVKNRIAFYGSTPAYSAVLNLHGLGDLQPQLSSMARQQRWDEMGPLIPDELLEQMAAVGTLNEATKQLAERWAPVAESISLYAPYRSDPTIWPEIARALRDIT